MIHDEGCPKGDGGDVCVCRALRAAFLSGRRFERGLAVARAREWFYNSLWSFTCDAEPEEYDDTVTWVFDMADSCAEHVRGVKA